MVEPTPFLTAKEALERLLALARPIVATESVPTLAANGRILAQSLSSPINVPEVEGSERDGYAVCASDCGSGSARLKVTQRITAGKVSEPLEPGTVARIFTGAMVPQGADAIVMQEYCEAHDDGTVTLNYQPESGEWVRRIGEDIKKGSVIFLAGTRMRAQEMGLAASVGFAELPVVRRLRVAIFFTGNELAMPGETRRAGGIYNSNRFILRGLLENLGCDISDYGIVPDSLQATRTTLARAAAEHDLIITSGGVSVGEEDYIKPAVEAEGQLNLWQLAVKPGKPLAFGEINRAAPAQGMAHFIGLPGNPVSVLIMFMLFVRPFIFRLLGVHDVTPKSFEMRADFTMPKGDRRNEFLRARINDSGGLDLFSNQGSAVMTSTVWGDGLIDNPANNAIHEGDMVRFLPFSELLY